MCKIEFSTNFQINVVTFDALKKRDSDVITNEEFQDILTILEDTEQLPVRVLIQTEEKYPFNLHHKISGQELAQKVNPTNASLNKSDFVRLLLSNEVCVWGACWGTNK